MVTQFGMPRTRQHVDYANEQQSYLGLRQRALASPDIQSKIDDEVSNLVDEGYETAKRILTEKHEEFDRLARVCWNTRP